jgi:hypothetical protein
MLAHAHDSDSRRRKDPAFLQRSGPAYFHAIIGGEEVLIAIRSLEVLRGTLPPGKLRQVVDWARVHQAELALNWIRVQDDETPESI